VAFDLTGTAAQPLALLCSEVIEISSVIVFTQKEYLPKKMAKSRNRFVYRDWKEQLFFCLTR
jgi:hypothetical protein